MTIRSVIDLHHNDNNSKLLLAFPFSGATAYSYNIFKNSLCKSINLSAVQYPGRGDLINNPLIYNMDEMISYLYNPVLSYLNSYKKIWIYGHSLGGLIAYNLLSVFIKNKINISHCMLNIGACPSPDSTNKEKYMHQLNDDLFWSKIQEYRGIPDSIINNNDFKSFLIPILKADFTISETYSLKLDGITPLPIPIKVFGGTDDRIVKHSQLSSWRNFTTARFMMKMISGDHFFLNINTPTLLGEIFD